MTSDNHYEYDVALSFAGEDRSYADALANTLHQRGLNVFYDKYEAYTIWGKNLYDYLSDLYQNKAHYCVIFISEHYARKLWTTHELKAAQSRAFNEKKEYILPVRLDRTKIPSILPTMAYLSWPPETAETLAEAIMVKLNESFWRTAEQCLAEGQKQHGSGNFRKALAAYEQAIRIDPNCAVAYSGRAKELDRLNLFEEAIKSYKIAIKFNPHDFSEDGPFQSLINLLFYEIKRYDEAIEAIEQMIQLGTLEAADVAFCFYRKGQILEELKRYDEAIFAYNQGIESDDGYITGREYFLSCRIEMAEVLEKKKEFDKALVVYDEAIAYLLSHERLYSSSYDTFRFEIVLQKKTRLLTSLRRYEEALATYDQIIQSGIQGVIVNKACKWKGDLLLSLKRFEEALEAYDLGLQLERLYYIGYQDPIRGYKRDEFLRELYLNNITVLGILGRKDEANAAYEIYKQTFQTKYEEAVEENETQKPTEIRSTKRRRSNRINKSSP